MQKWQHNSRFNKALRLLVISWLFAMLFSQTISGQISRAEGETIRIYSSLPLTSSSNFETQGIVNGMKMALEDFTGGSNVIGRFVIDYVPLDDATAAKNQWDADQEKANASKAVNDPDAMVYLGTFNSGAAKISIPITNIASMPMISPANSYPGLTKNVPGLTDSYEPAIYYPTGVRNYFRVFTEDDKEGKAAAAYAATLGAKKIYLIDDSQAFGRSLVDSFVRTCPDNELDCSIRKSINGREQNYEALVADIKDKNPDLIFFGGITEQNAGKLITDIRAAGITVPFLSGDGILNDSFIKDAGSAGEGSLAILPGNIEANLPAKGQEFFSKYRDRFGAVPSYAIYGYEAMSAALNAIQKAGVKDRRAILNAIAAIQDSEGVLGTWSFDKNGDISLADYTVYQVTGGSWQAIGVTRPKA